MHIRQEYALMRIKQEYTLQRILSEKCIHIADKWMGPMQTRMFSMCRKLI